MKSKLLIALVAALLASPAYAQFLGGSAADDDNVTEKPLGETPKPEGRTPDRDTQAPQQVDFSAPEQMDFSMNAASPHTPAEGRNRTPARRAPARIDRNVDRLADEAVDSLIGASATAKKNEVDRPAATGFGPAPRGFAGGAVGSR